MKLRGLIAAIIMLATVVMLPSHLSAHTPSGANYAHAWQERTINYYLSNVSGHPNYWSSIPGLADRIVESMVTWNNAPANFHYNNAGVFDNLDPTCGSQAVGVNGIFWGPIDGTGPILGWTVDCSYESGRLHSTNITIDGQENWYTGTGTPAANAFDLRSVATHEFGHGNGMFLAASGANHWNGVSASLCPGNANDQTMCANHAAGTTFLRTLASHDSHTFTNRYPQ